MEGNSFGISVFIGPTAALRPIAGAARLNRTFALTPQASLFVLPLSQEVRDQLHMANGTGEWLDTEPGYVGAVLTTTDMAVALRASAGSALAWIATAPGGPANFGDGGGQNHQGAAVWIDGALAMQPTLMVAGERRPRKLWPVNMALRLMGVVVTAAATPQDETEWFGLAGHLSNEALIRNAFAKRL